MTSVNEPIPEHEFVYHIPESDDPFWFDMQSRMRYKLLSSKIPEEDAEEIVQFCFFSLWTPKKEETEPRIKTLYRNFNGPLQIFLLSQLRYSVRRYYAKSKRKGMLIDESTFLKENIEKIKARLYPYET